MEAADWPQVERIYRDGIEGGQATFESATPSWDEFDTGKREEGRLVAVEGDVVRGWIAGSAVSARRVYRGVVEHSVYVDRLVRGRGIGRILLEAFIEDAESRGVWTIQSSIFPENEASGRLHAACGFRVVGRRERIGRQEVGPLAGLWRDTLLIERRSATPERTERQK